VRSVPLVLKTEVEFHLVPVMQVTSKNVDQLETTVMHCAHNHIVQLVMSDVKLVLKQLLLVNFVVETEP